MVERIRVWISKRRPIIIENSKIPIWLSKIAPINIHAFSFACFVVCRSTMSETTKRHEIIHYHQQLEMLFAGQWLAYGIFWLINFARYRDGQKAYYLNPFEKEAYATQRYVSCLEKRLFWNWLNYVRN